MEHVSGILALGAVNSGMFDTIEFSTDVAAVHFVGDNNVGKTSLIEMMQFLYFPHLKDMLFAKPYDESMRFYFRPEGSYIVFCVRTMQNTIRTIGVHGKGSTASRQYFVYDGRFSIRDFLDAENKILPFQEVQRALASRRFYQFTSFDAYERALIGNHADSNANVELFSYSGDDFHMLQNLLKNLLRLNQITSNDVRAFLHQYAEKQGLTMSIDIAQHFAEKTARMDDIQRQLDDIARIAPLIARWDKAHSDFQSAQATLATSQARAWHLHTAALTMIAQQQQRVNTDQQQVRQQIEHAEQEQAAIYQQQAELHAHIRLLTEQRTALQQLTPYAQLDTQQLQEQADQLAEHIGALRAQLRQPQDANDLRHRLDQRRQQKERLVAALSAPSLNQLLNQAPYSADERALAHYLINHTLLEQQSHSFMHDQAQLHATVQSWLAACDADGTFVGWGLTIPASEWRRPVPTKDIRAQIAEAERDIATLDAAWQVAKDDAAARKHLQALEEQRRHCDRQRTQCQRYHDIQRQYGSPTHIDAQISAQHAQHTTLEQQLASLKSRLSDLRGRDQRYVIELNDYDAQYAELNMQLRALPDASTVPADPDLGLIPDAEIFIAVKRIGEKCMRDANALLRSQQQVDEAQQDLERLYDNYGEQSTFAAWLTTIRARLDSMAQLNIQLQDSINDLATYISGELKTLVKAYEFVQNRINALQQSISQVQISNIRRISLHLEPSELLTNIQQWQEQQSLFDLIDTTLTPQQRAERIRSELSDILLRNQRAIVLDNLYTLKFVIEYADGSQRETPHIHQFESNGTNIGVKIIIYLGLIRLLSTKKTQVTTRIPFFLDEVGSLSANNIISLIDYCARHHFLPVFASPTPNEHISHNYIIAKNGKRSRLVDLVLVTPTTTEESA
jgi:hypothetical protein